MLENLNTPVGHGAVICFTNTLIPISDNVDAIPVGICDRPNKWIYRQRQFKSA